MAVQTTETMTTAFMKRTMYMAIPTTITLMMTRPAMITALLTAGMIILKTNKNEEQKRGERSDD